MSKNHEDCPMQPDIDELLIVFRSLAQKIDVLIGQNYNLMRLMLIALILLALGKGGLDIWKEVKGVPNVVASSVEVDH